MRSGGHVRDMHWLGRLALCDQDRTDHQFCASGTLRSN
jgi:hypothetical protein